MGEIGKLRINLSNTIGGSWLDEPKDQNIGGLSPTMSAPMHCRTFSVGV